MCVEKGDEKALVSKMELRKNALRIRLYYMYESFVCTVIDVDDTARRVEIKNYTDNLMLRAFGPNTEPTYDEYQEFLESRCFPRTRDKIKLELARLEKARTIPKVGRASRLSVCSETTMG